MCHIRGNNCHILCTITINVCIFIISNNVNGNAVCMHAMAMHVMQLHVCILMLIHRQ
jgi:hypothetical protein